MPRAARRAGLAAALVLAAASAACQPSDAAAPEHGPVPTPVQGPLDAAEVVPSGRYPLHTEIVATTFWVGEVFDPNAPDGSQEVSAYDGDWLASYGGCDGVVQDGVCTTEPRTAENGFFPTRMTPLQNPFYLDLPFDDVNDPVAAQVRASVVPWAHEPAYADVLADPDRSLMKDRWVALRRAGRVCFGQVQDAGPGEYRDAAYVFGHDDARPANQRYGGAGLDVSPALNGCLGMSELDGSSDRVDWWFVDDDEVPEGPWTRVVTTG